MAPQKKLAWILLGLFLIGFPAWLILALPQPGMGVPGRLLMYDRPAAMWVAQLASIGALAAVLWARKESRRSGEGPEARDKAITMRAAYAAGYVSSSTLVVATLVILFVARRVRGTELIPLDLLVLTVLLTGVVWLLTFLAATLVNYRRGGT